MDADDNLSELILLMKTNVAFFSLVLVLMLSAGSACRQESAQPTEAETQAAEGFKQLASLRWVVLGGEPIQMGRLRQWLNLARGTAASHSPALARYSRFTPRPVRPRKRRPGFRRDDSDAGGVHTPTGFFGRTALK